MVKPQLSRIQRSWLQEIGIDARMLAHFSTEPFAQAAPQAGATPAAAMPAPQQQDVAAPPAQSEGLQPATAAFTKPAERPGSGTSPGAAIIAGLLNRTSASRATGRDGQGSAIQGAVQHPQADSLQALREHAEQCTACGLHQVRGRVVFGEGTETTPQWMFVGEAPGEYDDSTGRPFQGRPGELLRAMLASIGLDDNAPAYFTNVLKCRPMGNRSPQAAEVAACLPLLQQQIQLLKPACLVALGRVSAGALLGSTEDLDTLRGRVHSYVDADGRSIPLVVTHHPAALLLHGQLKAEAWRDLNLLPGLRA